MALRKWLEIPWETTMIFNPPKSIANTRTSTGGTVHLWCQRTGANRERIVSALAIAALLVFGSSLDGVVLVWAVVAIMAVTLVVEHIRVERPFAAAN